MKIEVGESIVRSWLRHVEKCEFAELNWKPSSAWTTYNGTEVGELFNHIREEWPEPLGQNSLSQFLKQAEVDVLGLSTREAGNPRLHLVDIAFHSNGLNYGSAERTGQRIYKKLVRSALLSKAYFPTYQSTVYFVTPVISPNTKTHVEEAYERVQSLFEDDNDINFQLILGDDFKSQIFDEVTRLGDDVADTSELFLRSLQMINLFPQNQDVAPNVRPAVRATQPFNNETVVDNQRVFIVALYLARFEHTFLDLGNQTATINTLAERLGTNPHTLKNYRDRFDSFVDNHRVGWGVPLSDHQQAVLDEYSEYSELNLREQFSDLL